MNESLRGISLCATVLVLAAPAWAGPLAGQEAAAPGPDVGSDETRALTLMPGDALKIGIWREEDLSGKFVVEEDGVVTLPLLGDVRVTEIPLHELEDALLERYRVELRNPSIQITPLRRIHVLGEVNKPQLLAVDPTMSLAGAVASAGGASPQGDINKIRVMRDGEVLYDDVGPEQDLVSIDVRSGDQIFVGRRNWFERHSPVLVSATIGVAGIIVQLLR